MKKIETTIIINAPKTKVWDILSNFNLYAAWNPFIQKIDGELKEGALLKNTLIIDGKENHFTPTITALDEGNYFEWLGSLPINMFNGRHYFKLEKITEDQTRLIHGEVFTGWLHLPILWLIQKNTLIGFEAMNGALKQRAEQGYN